MTLSASPHSLFVYRRQVTFAETDAAGVAHFSRLFCWAEEAEHAFWRAHGFAVHESSAAQFPAPVGWPRVETHGKFFRPLRLDEELTLRLDAEILDECSLRWRVQVFVEAQGQEKLAAEVLMIVVAVSEDARAQWQKTPIPPEMRNALRLAHDLGG